MQDATGRRRRHHSGELKSEILAACAEPGASVAGVALQYGINANLVHRWRRRTERQGRDDVGKGALAQFVPLTISDTPVVTATEDIRIELRRGTCSISIAWPTSAAAVCASWLRELVR